MTRRPLAGLAVLTLALSACAHAGASQPKPGAAVAAAAAKKPDGGMKPWSEALKDTRPTEGFFKAHLKRDHTLFLEVRPDQLDSDFGMVMHYSRGVGVFNAHDGLPLSEMQLMRFTRVGDKLYLVHRNPRFTAADGSPMRASLDDNVGHSVTAAFKIESEHDSTKALLIDATAFFVSDYPQLGENLKWYYGNKPVTFDKERSWAEAPMGFPTNLEVDVLLTYRANDFPITGAPGVSDVRSIPIGVRYSLIALPETPMRARLADDRVGHFLDAVRDFSRDRETTPYVRYVNRWRLEKKYPDQAVSEPVQPIVYYIDRSVPVEYRRYVAEGIEAWNKAFDKAGFRNAIVAKQAPTIEEDSTWSAEDARYSTVRWTAAHQMGYAIGPSQTDPRTGEILNADVLISSTFVTGWNAEYQQLIGEEGMLTRLREAELLQRTLPAHHAARMCLAEMGKAHQLGMQHAWLVASGLVDGTRPMPIEYLGDAIRDLVMHEVGHTLGLRHNFKGSSAIEYDRLNDRDYTQQHGLTLSVMDYAATNIALDPASQGHFVNMEVGSYDVWAIQYAYAPMYEQSPNGPLAFTGTPAATAEAELVGLRKIAGRAPEALHAYNTDEDTHLGGMAVDPTSNTWDLGSDPLRYARDRAALVARIQPRIEYRLIADGESYSRLRGAVNGLLFEKFTTLLPVTKNVGGLYFARDHKGDVNGRAPFTPVPAARQREAVGLIMDNAFAEGAFEVPAELLNKLAPNRFGDWISWGGVPIDFPMHETVGVMHRWLLEELLHNGRLARMIDNTVRMPDGEESYTVAELFRTVTDGVWSELGQAPRAPRNIDSFRRNLQRAHIEVMSAKLLDLRPTPTARPAPEDARSLARLELTRLSRRLATAASAGSLDVETRAHLAESRARVDRALTASLELPAK